jgi:hypothetical protein
MFPVYCENQNEEFLSIKAGGAHDNQSQSQSQSYFTTGGLSWRQAT